MSRETGSRAHVNQHFVILVVQDSDPGPQFGPLERWREPATFGADLAQLLNTSKVQGWVGRQIQGFGSTHDAEGSICEIWSQPHVSGPAQELRGVWIWVWAWGFPHPQWAWWVTSRSIGSLYSLISLSLPSPAPQFTLLAPCMRLSSSLLWQWWCSRAHGNAWPLHHKQQDLVRG